MPNKYACALLFATAFIAVARAADDPGAVTSPQTLKLTGAVAEAQFEIILDQHGGYYRHEWHGKPGDENSSGFDKVELQLSYWTGIKGQYWSELGGRGGGSSQYGQTDPDGAPGKRLVHDGAFGANSGQLKLATNRHAEEFEKLQTLAGILLRVAIRYTDKASEPNATSTYIIKTAELLPDPGAHMIFDLKLKLWGDTRYKDSFYPNGKIQTEWVFEGDLPVRSTTFYDNGNKQYENLFVNGNQCSDSRWFADGHFQSTSVSVDGGYTWVEYADNGHKASEGQWTYTAPTEGLQSLTTGWELRYYASGRKKEIYHVRNSKMEGLRQSWDEKGQLVDDGTYHDDKPWNGTFVNIKSDGGVRGFSVGNAGQRVAYHYKDGQEVNAPPSIEPSGNVKK